MIIRGLSAISSRFSSSPLHSDRSARTMTCRDLDNAWIDRLDARHRLAESPTQFDDHLAGCESCRRKAEGFRLLERALDDLDAPAVVSSRFVEHLVSQIEREFVKVARPLAFQPRTVGYLSGLAALVIVGLTLALHGTWTRSEKTSESVDQANLRGLPDAFARATSATWELARETSAPAARLGRIVLDSSPFASAEGALPSRPELPVSGEGIQAVGERVGEGVKPLAGSARKAFDFLLGPVDEGDAPPADRVGRGA